MSIGRIEVPFGAQNLIIETGKLAKQANGAVLLTLGGTSVLVTACMSRKPKEGTDFFPLMVEYQEKTYAAGRIPGGFFKREGRPTEKEILTSRVIDRPIRPLFPEGFFHEVQVVATVLSHDGQNDADVLGLVGASAALHISDIPFSRAIGAVRVAMIDGQFVINPTFEQRETATSDFVVAGHPDGLIMIEGESEVMPEDQVVEGLRLAQEAVIAIAKAQDELRQKIGLEKSAVTILETNKALFGKVRELAHSRLTKTYEIADKGKREEALGNLLDEFTKDMAIFDACKRDDKETITSGQVRAIFDQVEYEVVRTSVFERGIRADGRGLNEVRKIDCEVGVLPRTHGTGLFTRGQTQSLAVVTLGTRDDEQMVEALEGTSYKKFMLHYNFPSFSVGETKPMRGPGRREIGHGALAGKSFKAVLPSKDDFPYTIRVVSEVLESNGSSSMASVCAGTLSLMDAGVPIKDAVAGISVGLISDAKRSVLITDIMGLEDHFGDMDFKVAGTRKGVTAIQLDLKIKQVSVDLLAKAMTMAKDARLMILDKMQAAIAAPRAQISDYAPRIIFTQIDPSKIGEVIGPGGKMIKKIIEETGVSSIDIEDDGKVLIASATKESAEKAKAIIEGMTVAPVVGTVYDATVKKIMAFGAFVEFMPGKEGLVHVSELSSSYVKDVESVVKVGDKFKVKLVEIDKMGRLNLSKKQAE
jgi:polyribonucleotide nucleotidyltransferase